MSCRTYRGPRRKRLLTIALIATMMIAVPDYMNLPIWLFLGIAYE